MSGVPLDDLDEHPTLNVLALFLYGGGGEYVADPYDVLFNNWAFVQVSGDIVSSGANRFHALPVRLGVGTGSFE